MHQASVHIKVLGQDKMAAAARANQEAIHKCSKELDRIAGAVHMAFFAVEVSRRMAYFKSIVASCELLTGGARTGPRWHAQVRGEGRCVPGSGER